MKKGSNMKQLIKQISQVWISLSKEYAISFVESLPRRCTDITHVTSTAHCSNNEIGRVTSLLGALTDYPTYDQFMEF